MDLLPACLDGPRELAATGAGAGKGAGCVAKPLLGREGAGVTIHEPGSPAVLRDEPCCHQELAALADYDGNRVVLGAWVVQDEAAGLGIRESAGLVTDEYAHFLPHVILSRPRPGGPGAGLSRAGRRGAAPAPSPGPPC